MAEQPGSLTTFGRYQKRLCIILFLVILSTTFAELQFLVTHYGAPYRCWTNGDDRGTPTITNYVKNDTRTWESVTAVSPSLLLVDNSCDVDNKNGTGSITGTIYCVFDSTHTSVVTEFNLVCDKAWVKPLFVSIYMVGKMIGGQSGGAISDEFGRRVVFLLSTLGQFVSAFVLSLAGSPTSYAVLVFICGFFGTVRYQASVLLCTELINPAKRAFAYFCLAIGFAVGYVIMPLTAYVIHDWRWWLRLTAFIGVLYIPCYWLIDETPIWLLAAGRKNEAIAMLNKISKYNGEESELENGELEVLKDDAEKSEGMWKTIKSLVRTPILLARTLIIVMSWMVVNMTYYAIALNNDNLSGDWLWNMFFGGLVELGAIVAYYLFSKAAGLRNSFFVLMLMTSVTLATTPFVAEVNGTAGVTVSMISKFNVTVAFCIIYIYTGEMFPTHARHTVLAMSSALSRLGGILSPFIIYADETSGSVAPSVGTAAVIFLSAISYLWLPKTKNKVLPQTVADAAAMKSKVFKARCCCDQTETA